MRELRVEDALLYLDQVKMEFGDKPQIYNEFLDIMKTFKTQQIDTPGVIRRVSTLFQGNRRLVLGFNTFLPEGYQIELPPDGNGPPVAIYREPGSNIVHRLDGGDDHAARQPYEKVPGSGPAGIGTEAQKPPPEHSMHTAEAQAGKPPAHLTLQQRVAASNESHPHAPGPAAHGRGTGRPGNNQDASAPQEFDHAIEYVTTIKRRFQKQPEIYKQFLQILHTYQREERGIKEVLNDVSSLFADHPDLLKQFTYFLPDAVQAQAKAQLDLAAKEAENRQKKKAEASSQDKGSQQQTQKITPRPRPPTEFDSDGVPIAFGATKSRSVQRENAIVNSSKYGVVSFSPQKPPRIGEPSPSQRAAQFGRPKSIPSRSYELKAWEDLFFERVKEHLGRPEFEPVKSQNWLDDPVKQKNTPYNEFLKCIHLFGAGILNKEELLLLLRSLFTKGQSSSTTKIPSAVVDYGMELIANLETLMFNHGYYSAQLERNNKKSPYGSVALHKMDYDEHKRLTPSYWEYPAYYPMVEFMKHSGQSQEDFAVLNNTLLCVNVRGQVSEESYDGIKARMNVYEQAMMRIEEERYEADMAIELNAQAMRVIEPYAEEARALKEQEEKDGQPIGRLDYKLKPESLKVVHINAIGRLYGDHGDEIIQHLQENPLVVLPIIYRRLKQKDAEWRKIRDEMTKRWNAINESNFEGSLDVQCYAKRKALEHVFRKAQLLEECNNAKDYCKSDPYLSDKVTAPYRPIFQMHSNDPTAFLYQPFLSVPVASGISNKHALQLVSLAARSHPGLSESDSERIGRIWAEFIFPWFRGKPHWVAEEVRNGMMYTNSSVVQYVPGQPVMTIYGDGTVLESDSETGTNQYRVRLPFGVGHLNAAAILHSNENSGKSFYVRRDGIMVEEKRRETSLESSFLGRRHKLLFATENVYVFMRLYVLLVNIISEMEVHLTAYEPAEDPSVSYHNPAISGERTGERPSFSSLLTTLKHVVTGKTETKTFETLGRRCSKEKVHEISALPRLIELCSLYLIKVVQEDCLLSLYDCCRPPSMDLIAARSRCFAIHPDATYRIQFNEETKEMAFMYLPKRRQLALTVQEFPGDDSDVGVGPVAENDVEQEEESVREDINPRESKRLKPTNDSMEF